MASISATTEMGAPGASTTNISRESVVAHMGATCDDCGGDHAVYPTTQHGVHYLLCESCYEYTYMVAEVDDDVGEQDDDFEAEEEEWDDEELDVVIVGSAAWWAGGEQDARDNGAYGLLTSAGGGW